jgi:hypothetical protein
MLSSRLAEIRLGLGGAGGIRIEANFRLSSLAEEASPLRIGAGCRGGPLLMINRLAGRRSIGEARISAGATAH